MQSMCMRAKSLQLCPTLCDPIDCSPPGSSVHEEYWSGLPCHSLRDLLGPGIKPASPVAPALQEDSLPLSNQGVQMHSTGSISPTEQLYHAQIQCRGSHLSLLQEAFKPRNYCFIWQKIFILQTCLHFGYASYTFRKIWR